MLRKQQLIILGNNWDGQGFCISNGCEEHVYECVREEHGLVNSNGNWWQWAQVLANQSMLCNDATNPQGR